MRKRKTIKQSVKEALEEIMLDECHPIKHINKQLNHLQTMGDRFDVYMENVNRLNFMVNELKGMVTYARARGIKTKTHNKKESGESNEQA